MTTVAAPPHAAGTEPGTRREHHRRELGTVLGVEPGNLADPTPLADLGLDSLARMSLLTWMESNGLTVGGNHPLPASVGELLSLLESVDLPGLSVRLVGAGEATAAGAGDLPLLSSPAGSGRAPVLQNHEIRLTMVEPDDTRFLYTLATHPDTCYRWRYRGNPPPVDRFAADLWSKVLVQFVARRADDGEPVGHVIAYGADVGQGYAYLGAVFVPWYTGTGLAAQAVAMFVRYLFHTQPLRKLYMEVPGFNWEQVRSGEGRLFQVEGVMREHEHFAGRYWDRYLCAIYPDRGPQRDD